MNIYTYTYIYICIYVEIYKNTFCYNMLQRARVYCTYIHIY